MNATLITVLLSLLIPAVAWVAIVFLERGEDHTGEDDLHSGGQNAGPLALRGTPKQQRLGGSNSVGQVRDEGVRTVSHKRDLERRTGDGGW
jgi:hypothetical protein